MHKGIASQKCLCIADSLSCPGNKSVHASIAVKLHNSIPTCVCLSARPKLSNLTSMQRGARQLLRGQARFKSFGQKFLLLSKIQDFC